MDESLYVMFIERGKTYNKLTQAMVVKHVEHIKKLDCEGKIELCGAFKGYPGMAGMVVLRAESFDEADEICKTEPLVTEGFATYKLREFFAANKENGYLL